MNGDTPNAQRTTIDYLMDKLTAELADKILSFTCAIQADSGERIDVWPDEDEWRWLVLQARLIKGLTAR